MGLESYPVELHLKLGEAAHPSRRAVDIDLYDLGVTGHRRASGQTFFDLNEIVPGANLAVRSLHEIFLHGDGGAPDDGLMLGRFLLKKLLADDVGPRWRELTERRRAAGRPLRLELVADPKELADLAELPFELLADDDGFLFRRHGAALVRVPPGLHSRAATIPPGGKILVAWAQPKGAPHVSPDTFAAHEQGVAEAARTIGLVPLDPCQHVTLRALEDCLAKNEGTRIVSLVAHGDAKGGHVHLHVADHSAYPADPGEPISGESLSQAFNRSGVSAVLLWACHGARRDTSFGDVASQLLRSEGGNVAAVVASPAALRASATARVAKRIFEELGGAAERDFERAVSHARRELGDADLQWAAPMYFARPLAGRSVTLAEVVVSLSQPRAERGRVLLERAPDPWPHFQGRDDEIERGLALLRAGRLVTVIGMPGIGKTDLSLVIARRAMAAQGFERALWVPLNGIRTSSVLVAELAQWAGLSAEKEATAADVAAHLRDQAVLLVLDNAEDVIRSDGASFRADLDALLSGCPGLRLLVASRELVGGRRVAEERSLHVGPLPLPDARRAFVSAAGERLTAEEKESHQLEDLLRWLDGHPLSLMLLARQVGEVSLAGLLRRIHTREAEAVVDPSLLGEELGAEQDDELRRDRLISSLNLSFEPLAKQKPDAAEMFSWLGLFPAGLVGRLVPLVFGEEGEDHRGLLVRRSLVEVIGSEQRLFLPAPIRAYARAKLKALSAERKQQLLAASFQALAGWFYVLYGQRGTVRAREAMHAGLREDANVAALVEALKMAALPEGAPIKAAIAHGLWALAPLYAQIMSHAGQAQMGAQRLEDIAQWVIAHAGAGAAEANTQKSLGDLFLSIDRLKEAEEAYRRALPIYQSIDDRLGEANTQQSLGDLFLRTDRLKEAEEAYRRALPVYQSIDNRLGEANTQQSLGDIFRHTDRLQEAEEAYRRALPIYQSIDERLGEANTHKSLGDLFLRSARLKEAEEAYRRALPIFQSINERHGEANTQLSLGDLFLRTGRLKEAEDAFRRALPIFQSIDERLGEANTQQSLGDIFHHTDRLKEAEEAYRRALPIYQSIDERLGEANTHKSLGDLFHRTDRLKEAEEAFRRALPILQSIDNRLGEANTQLSLGDLFLRTGRLKEAEEAYRRALPIYQSIDSRLGEANTQLSLGDLFLRTDQLKEAEEAYRRALPIYQSIDDRLGEANTHAGFGNLELLLDQPHQAFHQFRAALRIHMDAEDALGAAAAHGYMGRAAALAGNARRAAALSGRTWHSLGEIEDRFGQILALQDLALALAQLGRMKAASSALVLAWKAATVLGEPLADQFAQALGLNEPPGDLLSEAPGLLTSTLAELDAELAAAGEDLYAPL